MRICSGLASPHGSFLALSEANYGRPSIDRSRDLSIISAGDLPFVSSHLSNSKMRTRCSIAGCWTRTVTVCPRPIWPTHSCVLKAESACATAS